MDEKNFLTEDQENMDDFRFEAELELREKVRNIMMDCGTLMDEINGEG